MISVALFNYNDEKYIKQAILGITEQTYENLQIIIVDDGSTDGSGEIIRNAIAGDKRVHFAANKENKGFLKVFPEAMSLCNGDFFMGCGSDDFITDKNFFKKCIEAQDMIPSSGCYGKTERVDIETGVILGYNGFGIKEGLITAKEFVKGFFAHDYFVPGYSAMWRKSFIDAVGGYPMDLGPQNDYFINHVLPSIGGVHFFDENVAVTRIKPTSMSMSASVHDKIIRHATFEKRMIETTKFEDQELVANWREQLIYDLCDGKEDIIGENRQIYLETLHNYK